MNKIPISNLNDTFGRVKLHQNIGNIIQEKSTNPNPIGSVAYKGIYYNEAIRVADIGCGYGRFIDHLNNIVPKNSVYVGIDPIDNNQNVFLSTTESAGYRGKYLHGDANCITDFPNGYFDLILCNYSLYFFIDILPIIKKKLKSDGLFITITHSINSLKELLTDLQIALNLKIKPSWNKLGSEQVLDNFNSENGFKILHPHFEDIQIIEYQNTLEFYTDDIDSLFDLLEFKKTSLIHHNDYADFIRTKKFDDTLRKTITAKIDELGKYILNKDDAVFRCRKPI